jgi:hypothetical protein
MSSPGDLVKVGGVGPAVDGIVFDTPSSTKVVVAVVDPKRGPVFRTVNPDVLTPRAEAGPHDQALHLLVKRTPVPVRGPARGTAAGGQGRSGHHRGAPHRATGR